MAEELNVSMSQNFIHDKGGKPLNGELLLLMRGILLTQCKDSFDLSG